MKCCLHLSIVLISFLFFLVAPVSQSIAEAASSKDTAAWILVYNSDITNFSDWQTNHPSKFFYNNAVGAYHYGITDAAQDYAFAFVPYTGGSFQLEFDVRPIVTDWAGNFRLGLWDQQMQQERPNCVSASYSYDDNGHHIYLECYWPEGSASVRPSGYSDDDWYHTVINYSAGENTATIKVVRQSDGATFVGTVAGLGQFVGLNRIALTSIGDLGYPGATATGYIAHVKLSVPDSETAVFDSPRNGTSIALSQYQTLLIRFHLVDAGGNRVTAMRNPTLEVTEVSSPNITTKYLFSIARGNLRYEPIRAIYTATFQRVTSPARSAGECMAVVKENDQSIGSIQFDISPFQSLAR